MAELQLNKKPKLILFPEEDLITPPSDAEIGQTSAFTLGANPSADEAQVISEAETGFPQAAVEAIDAQEQENAVRKEQTLEGILLDPTLPPEAKIESLRTASQAPTDASLREVFNRHQAQNSAATSQTERDILDGKLNYLTFYAELPAITQRIIGEETTYNPDNAIIDVVSAVGLPGYAFQLKEVLEKALPGFTQPGDDVLPGNMVERFKEDFINRPQTEQLQIIRRIAKAAEENTFYGRDNGAIKRDVLVSLLADLKPSSSEKIILNVISILDLLALAEFGRAGAAAFRGLKNGAQLAARGELGRTLFRRGLERKAAESVSGQLDLVDPAKSAEAARKVLSDEIVPESMGVTKVTATDSHILPDPSNLHPTAAPSINDPLDEVMGYDGRAVAFDDAETSGLVSRAGERAKAILATAPTLHINKMQFETLDDDTLRAKSIIGLPGSGFATFRDAYNARHYLREEFPTEVLVRDGRDNTLKPFKEVPQEHRVQEFFLQYTDDLKLSAEDAIARNPILEGGLTGALAKFFTKSSFLQKIVSISGSAVGDAKAAKNKALSHMLIPLFRLDTKTRKVVEDIIDRGDQQGKFFSDDELYLEWGSHPKFQEMMESYAAFKRFQRAQYHEVNKGIRERLDAAGMKELVFLKKPQENVDMGRPVATIPNDVTRLYNPATDSFIDVSPDINILNIANKKIAKAGGIPDRSFIELRRPMVKGNEEVLYVLNTGNSSDLLIRALPEKVIKDVPGRIPRLYKVTHFVIKEVDVWRNGKLVKGTLKLKLARNDGDARRVAAEMQAADPDKKAVYRSIPADELRDDIEYANRTSTDYFEDTGQLWFSERGLELDTVDGTRGVMPVLDRLDAARERAAKINTLDLWVEKQVRSWEKEFGAEFGDANGKMPAFHEPLQRKVLTTRTEKGVTERRYRDAIAFRDHISMMAGTNRSLLERNISNLAVYIADKLATSKAITPTTKLRNRTATAILEARNFDPINLLKQAAFLKFIVANPARQLALQAQQASIYLTEPGALKYFTSGKGILEWNGLVLGLTTRHNKTLFPEVVKKASKALKMTPDEYVEFVDAMRQSGLLANIDSHAFSAGMLTDKTFGGSKGFIDDFIQDARVSSAFESFKNTRSDLLNGALRAAKAVRTLGFDAGEATHLIAAFLAKRNRWLIENPTKSTRWAKGKNLAEISGAARQISFEMTREGALGFQKGLMGLIFQFASHNTKALQALLPNTRILGIGKLSNKAFDNKQKIAIALSQFGIYGAGGAGYGAYEAWDWLKSQLGEVDETTDLLVKEGLFGSLLTAIVRGATEEPFDVDATGGLAPFSGIFGGTPIARLVADGVALGTFDIRKVPAGYVFKDLADTYDTIAFLTGKVVKDDLNMSELERAGLIFDTILRNAPIYNNMMKYRASLAIGRIISNTGDEGVKASGAELLAKGLFGLQSTADRQNYELTKELKGSGGAPLTGPIDEDLREYAKNIYQQVKKIQQRRLNEATPEQNVRDTLRIVRGIALADRELLDEFEYRRVHQQLLPELMYSDLREGTSESKLLNLMFKNLQNGEVRRTDAIIDEVANSKVLRDDDKKRIVQFLHDIGD